MNAFAGNIFRISKIFFVIVIFLLPACKPAPSDQMVKDLIVKYFETRNYHVIEIDIGEIKSLSLGEKTYMGTPGYLVNINSVTLEIGRDIKAPAPYRKGQYVTFTNSCIRIKEQPGQGGKWILSDISGIPLP